MEKLNVLRENIKATAGNVGDGTNSYKSSVHPVHQ
jgi:hypothetical protein